MANELMHTKRLESVGFTRRQAEAQVEIIRDYADNKFATRQDIKDLATEMRNEFALVRQEMAMLEQRMTIKFGSMMVVLIGVMVALKLL